jgi:hypothetical protein
MRRATRTTVATFGVIAGAAGVEHAIGEIRQGSVAPEGVVIASWPNSQLFQILNGEPAMTVVPNLLVTGLLAMFVSVGFMIWATMYVHRVRYGGWVLVGVSVLLLLVGGGFGPPLLGVILGLAATRINAPAPQHPAGFRRQLGKVWPWSLGAGVLAWLVVMPGTILMDRFLGIDNAGLIYGITFSAFGLLMLALITAAARDACSTSPPA